jgi:hypothetical protein
MADKIKFVVVVLVSVAIVVFMAWFIPAFMHEVSGTFECKAVGDVSVCWSIK